MTNSAASARGLLEQIAALYTGADYLAHLMDVICSIRTGSRLQYFVMSSSILRTLEKMPQTGAFPTDFWPKLPKVISSSVNRNQIWSKELIKS
ncbi:hypothetical protein Mp_4g19880 [Marchantia polymorpha subsp. ruderalis]|uniref:Uncharacterized protein n=2 Tax=Marchantia polymorpha TaxID=3197 RepID=A0AAF6BBS3_MARPO|nr:hypothetical protein MARPO_0126s0006 [Marchantia polymorpha]BBN09457.1 hypothetical protein Mp_4g19880 [Marchantia polymorpha subsp. ruderalis]|eukprot:PTQ30284.1 hypothetical protein MARPO_0126s0006 [Marchantia polymorpha]